MLNLGFRRFVPGLIALCLPLAFALPDGAPISSCGNMAPVHDGVVPQSTASPHSINTSIVNGTMQVRIMGPVYKGLLLQARKPNENTAVGTWSSAPQNTKTLACFNVRNSAMTHANTVVKDSNVVYSWNPTSAECIKVIFTATVAQEQSVYWLGVKSDEMMINCGNNTVNVSGVNGNGAVRTTSGLVLMMIWPLLVWLHSEE